MFSLVQLTSKFRCPARSDCPVDCLPVDPGFPLGPGCGEGLALRCLKSVKTRLGQSGQFADDLIDPLAQQPPGVSIRQDGNIRVGAKLVSLRSLLFQIHSIYSCFPANRARTADSWSGEASEARGSRGPKRCVPSKGAQGVEPGRFRDQAIWMLLACLPLGPVVMSKLTRWFSARVLKPWD